MNQLLRSKGLRLQTSRLNATSKGVGAHNALSMYESGGECLWIPNYYPENPSTNGGSNPPERCAFPAFSMPASRWLRAWMTKYESSWLTWQLCQESRERHMRCPTHIGAMASRSAASLLLILRREV